MGRAPSIRHEKNVIQPDAVRRYNVESISCGRDHTLALLVGGKVLGWGGDGSGRMPSGTPEYCSTLVPSGRPVEIGTRHAMVSIAAGHGISLGISVAKRALVWGASPAITAGRRSIASLVEPQPLAEVIDPRFVVAGEFLCGAIDGTGVVHTWGLNGEGALGRPTQQLNSGPGTVTALPPVSELAIGKGCMLALTRDGRVYGWGSNAAGQLGNGTLKSSPTPHIVLLKTQARAVAAGATHALVVTSDGSVWAWGSNHHGQLGREHPAYSPVPVAVELPERAERVAAGMHFSLALGESGRVYAWGWNAQGQLGLGDTTDRRSPTPVPSLASVRRSQRAKPMPRR